MCFVFELCLSWKIFFLKLLITSFLWLVEETCAFYTMFLISSKLSFQSIWNLSILFEASWPPDLIGQVFHFWILMLSHSFWSLLQLLIAFHFCLLSVYHKFSFLQCPATTLYSVECSLPTPSSETSFLEHSPSHSTEDWLLSGLFYPGVAFHGCPELDPLFPHLLSWFTVLFCWNTSSNNFLRKAEEDANFFGLCILPSASLIYKIKELDQMISAACLLQVYKILVNMHS